MKVNHKKARNEVNCMRKLIYRNTIFIRMNMNYIDGGYWKKE